ncbi:MAG: glycosyltransferase family 87 protein [Desulfobaccales bacterium]|jgi:hypothetical protein
MSWLNRERLTVYPPIIVALYIILGAYLLIIPGLRGGKAIDFMGKPLGADFSDYWSASSLALAGDPMAVYDFSRLIATQEAVTGVKFPLFFSYPPIFLLMVLPLALLPYLASLAAWLAVTLSIYLLVIRRIAPHPLATWLALAFPGTFQNFIQGQNGFLSAALLGGGLLILDRFPLTGGMLLGALSYKPHLAVLIPVALLAGRYWRALAGVIISAGSLALLSALIFGLGTWKACYQSIPFTAELLNSGSVPWFKMPTIYAAIRLAGGGLLIAQVLQGIAMLSSIIMVSWTWLRISSPASRAVVLTLAILLCTPYAFDYDLAMLALPLAWLGWEAHVKGWIMRGEKVLLLIGWLMPIIAPIIAKATNLQFGPIILIALIVLAFKRSKLGNLSAPLLKPHD